MSAPAALHDSRPEDGPGAPPSRARHLAWLVVGTFAANLAYFVVMRPSYPEWAPAEIPRNAWYAIAENVAAGRGFVLDSFLTYFATPDGRLVPTAARGPVPILFLAAFVRLFNDPYYPILFVTWLLSAGTSLATYGIARRIAGSHSVALLTAVLTGVHLSGMYINTTFSYCSEPLFIVLLALAVYCAYLAADGGLIWQAALSGLLLGVACLCRQTVIVLPVLYVLLFWFSQPRRVIRLSCAAVLSFVVVQAPWVVRNQLALGQPIMTSTLGGYGLFMAGVAARERQPGRFDYEWPDTVQARGEMLQALAAAGKSLHTTNEVEFDAILNAAAKRIIAENREGYIRNSLFNSVVIFYRHYSGRGLYLVQNAFYYLFAAVGLATLCFRRRWPLVVPPLLLVGYFVGIHAPFVPSYRYLFPATPFLFILTAQGLASTYMTIVRGLSERNRK